MKMIAEIEKDLDYKSKKLINNLIKAQEETARTIKDDVVKNLNVSGGKYVSSIQKGETRNKNGVIRTEIYTDLKSKDGYFIGRMIENGTRNLCFRATYRTY